MIQQSHSEYILKRIEIRISRRLCTPTFIAPLFTRYVCYFLSVALDLHSLPSGSVILPCSVGELSLEDSESQDVGLSSKFITNCKL